MQDSVKFDHEKFTYSITFLNTLEYIGKNGQTTNKITHTTHQQTQLSPSVV